MVSKCSSKSVRQVKGVILQRSLPAGGTKVPVEYKIHKIAARGVSTAVENFTSRTTHSLCSFLKRLLLMIRGGDINIDHVDLFRVYKTLEN